MECYSPQLSVAKMSCFNDNDNEEMPHCTQSILPITITITSADFRRRLQIERQQVTSRQAAASLTRYRPRTSRQVFLPFDTNRDRQADRQATG